MADVYPYPVFFECVSLQEEQMKKIERYLRISRRSGGGDCGAVRCVDDQIYSVAFKHQKDQRAVLQRPEHVVDGVEFTVRDSLERRPTSPITASSASQAFTAPAQSPHSIPASTPPSSGEEYVLQLDSYLLRYLKECPKAGKELEKQLASVACSAQLYPEEGRVLVRSLAQPGAAGEVRTWKAEVDKLFDAYFCHYEVDPHKVKALLQSCSSRQTTDEVKVYSEVDMAVVVGQSSQVKARLMGVVDVKRRSRLSEKRTTIRRLGEAKLRLLWKEIKHGLQQDFPGIKFTQGDAGQLVLEGSVEEILKAGDWISDKEKLVSERKVSDVSQHFLAFLKKAYGGPAVLADFLGVHDKVEIELRDTELRFSTLSADKLDDTEKKLQEKFKEAKIHVPNFSAVSSELRQKLKSKTNELNRGQYRAQVMFFSDSTVCLVGHTKEVEELSEVVTQFILDQSSVQNIVHLPFAELEENLPELLQLHGFDCSGVAFHPLTSSSVVLEGPSRKVTEVRNRLVSFLDTLPRIDPSGEVRSFRNPTGKDEFLNVEQNLASLSLTQVNTTVASYSLRDGLQVLVCQGDITKQDADALVNAANEDLYHCGGVAAALSKAGGPQVQKESHALVRQVGKIPPGDVVVTTGGNLNCKILLHAVGPGSGRAGGRERVLLEKTVQSALNLAEIMEFNSIAMPCISSGIFGVPVDVCSEAIVTAVKEFGSEGGRSLSRIILIDNRGEVVRAMQEACDRLLQGMDASAQDDTRRGAAAGDDVRPSQKTFKSAQETIHPKGFTKDAHQPDQSTKRIVLLGKTGSGKSHLANTIFGEELFTTNHSPNSGTSKCQAETKSVNGRSITLIDTPGFFDTNTSEEEMKTEIVRCITECAPGPHAFLIVLKVERFTEQEQDIINKIYQYFSEDALRYAVVVFTHGDGLPTGMEIEQFVSQNKNLNNLVQKCGGRCHVVDNTHWKNTLQDNYRSNRVQVEDLLSTIDKMVRENNGGYYSNEMLQAVEKEIQKVEEQIRQSSSGDMSVDEIRKQAKSIVSERFLIQLTGIATGALLGGFFGVAALAGIAIIALQNIAKLIKGMKDIKAAREALTAAAGGGGAVTATAAAVGGEVAGVATGGVLVGGLAAGFAATGGVIGGVIGYDAAKGAETPKEAAEMAANAVINKGKATLNAAFDINAKKRFF